ncbi:MAG TPA: thiamine phosphate synthase [Polyangia bacterium]|jgi:thiamine-phosphate pyrophosphorylase
MTGPAAPLLYLVTDRHATRGRPLPEVIARALDGLPGSASVAGTVAVQLREKDLAARPLLALARALRAVTTARNVRLFINDRVDVALASGADGVHLGGGALTVEDVDALAPGLAIAASTHSVAEVIQRTAHPRISFVVFGPVFETPSKRAYGPPLGISALRAACATGARVVAIGGIDQDRGRACREAGAAGIGAIRAVLDVPHPDQATAGFFGAIERT